MKNSLEHLVGKAVLVRAHLAGVYLGTLVSATDDGALRLRARRLWSWTGVLDCTTLAMVGPTGGKVGPESDVVLLPAAQVVEVIAASDAALVALASVPVWQHLEWMGSEYGYGPGYTRYVYGSGPTSA